MLGRWPEVFDPAVNPDAVRVTVTGRVPEPADFGDYPAYIRFDGAWDAEYTPGQLERVALISADFKRFSQWNGKGSIIPAEREKLERVIDKAHAWDKPVRFWGAPEGVTVYYTFYDMGIDYINTDRPELCAEFFNDFGNKNFQIGERRAASSTVTGTKRLDKATRDFKGFQSDKLQLSKGIDVYTPTYRNDGGKGKVKNVIFLIGDGMGLSQIVAAMFANKDLTLMGLKNIGLQQNNALDAFYDRFGRRRQRPGYGRGACEPPYLGKGGRNGLSFAERLLLRPRPCRRRRDAGRHRRRHADGVLRPFGRARQFGRADRVAAEGRLDLLCGSGIRKFTHRDDGIDLVGELSKQYDFVRSVDELNAAKGKVICIDEEMDEAAEEENLTLLADATRGAIEKLRERSGKGFFLMVEGAKIDYAGHSRCLPGSVIETLSFDLAVAEALKFADSNGETLVVVTADHETGGLTLIDGDEATGRIMGVYVSDDHTPVMLPVFAYGPGSDRFRGTYRNTEIPRRIKSLVK